jgi:hypothetical protein
VRQGFEFLCNLPFDADETAAAMTVWEALDKNCIVIATSKGRMFVLRFEKSGHMEFAGPLEWTPAP